MDSVTAIGSLASLCSIVSFTPQAWKIIRSRDVRSISTVMYAVTVTGFALWMAFGIMKGEWPIIITNAVCFVFAAFILAMKLMSDRNRDKVADTLDPAS